MDTAAAADGMCVAVDQPVISLIISFVSLNNKEAALSPVSDSGSIIILSVVARVSHSKYCIVLLAGEMGEVR